MPVRRAHPRYAVAVDISLVMGATTLNARSENLSMGGLCAELGRSLPLGEGVIVKLALVFPDNDISEPIEIGGRVVWSTPLGSNHQIGIQFTNVSEKAVGDIGLFLRFLTG